MRDYKHEHMQYSKSSSCFRIAAFSFEVNVCPWITQPGFQRPQRGTLHDLISFILQMHRDESRIIDNIALPCHWQYLSPAHSQLAVWILHVTPSPVLGTCFPRSLAERTKAGLLRSQTCFTA